MIKEWAGSDLGVSGQGFVAFVSFRFRSFSYKGRINDSERIIQYVTKPEKVRIDRVES